MTHDAAAPPSWSGLRMGALILLVLAGQLGCIFWLGEFRNPPVRPPAVSSAVRLASGKNAGWLALSDPTLFALPHAQGFSGLAWLRLPAAPSRPFTWSDSAYSLSLPVRELGAGFEEYVRTNGNLGTPPPIGRDIPMPLPSVPLLTMPRRQSTWRVEGDLAQRPWLNPPALPSRSHSDLLTNTVVGLLVDADGLPISVAKLGAGSGSPTADQFGMELARAARFQPRNDDGPRRVADPLRGLSWGTIVFEWHTVPPAGTNNPSQNSSSP